MRRLAVLLLSAVLLGKHVRLVLVWFADPLRPLVTPRVALFPARPLLYEEDIDASHIGATLCIQQRHLGLVTLAAQIVRDIELPRRPRQEDLL